MRNRRGLAFLQPIPAYLLGTSQRQGPAGSRKLHSCRFLFCGPSLNCTCPTVHFPLSFPLLPPLFQFADVGAAGFDPRQGFRWWVQPCKSRAMGGSAWAPLPEATGHGGLSCRRCAVLQELCHKVEELRQEASRLRSIREDERQDRIFSEAQQLQDSWTLTAVGTQEESAPGKAESANSGEGEEWKLVTAGTQKVAPAPPEDLQLWNWFTAHKTEELLSSEASEATDAKPCKATRMKQRVIVVGKSPLQGTSAALTCCLEKFAGGLDLEPIEWSAEACPTL